MARGLEWGRPEYAGPCHLDDVVLDKVIHGHDACADHIEGCRLEAELLLRSSSESAETTLPVEAREKPLARAALNHKGHAHPMTSEQPPHLVPCTQGDRPRRAVASRNWPSVARRPTYSMGKR